MFNITFNDEAFKDLAKEIEEYAETGMQEVINQYAYELADFYLATAKANTPIGKDITRKEIKNGITTTYESKTTEKEDSDGTKKLYRTVSKTVDDGKETTVVYRSDTQRMRQKWTVKDLEHDGNTTQIAVVNTASYASYVNDGHRQNVGKYIPLLGKRLVNEYVEGLHITDKAQNETRKASRPLFTKAWNKIITKD